MIGLINLTAPYGTASIDIKGKLPIAFKPEREKAKES
jgi:hypothetical protein